MKQTPDAQLLARFIAPRPSVEERKAAGEALRENVPHRRHAEYRPASKRADRVAMLEASPTGRLSETKY